MKHRAEPLVLAVVLVITFLAPLALRAQEIDPAVVSPDFEYDPAQTTPPPLLRGVFWAYATGATEGSYYYLFPTNTYTNPNPPQPPGECPDTSPTSALPPGECHYTDPVDGCDHRMGEQVVAYRGTDTFSFLKSSDPRFSRFRTVSPCFDGRFGEQTEQEHRSGAYGGGSLVYSIAKGKYYLTVNRTRRQCTPSSTTRYEQSSSGAEWPAGDFDQILIGAKSSLAAAVTTPTSSSGQCQGMANPDPTKTCSPAFAWSLSPILRITSGLVDPRDGQVKTFTAVAPILAAYDSSVPSLPMFSGIGDHNPVLWGFLKFGPICQSDDSHWKIPSGPLTCVKNAPKCADSVGPYRLAAVFVTDTSSTVRPSQARLWFKVGSSWMPMNGDGTFPTVPDDQFSVLGPFMKVSDIEKGTDNHWYVWGSNTNTESSVGCDEGAYDPGLDSNGNGTPLGGGFTRIALDSLSRLDLWNSQNFYGRRAPIVHQVHAPACNCMREFVFYTSSDRACYAENAAWHSRGTALYGSEVLVRRLLDGPPAQ
jgi:hypothetical protein